MLLIFQKILQLIRFQLLKFGLSVLQVKTWFAEMLQKKLTNVKLLTDNTSIRTCA